MRIAIRESDLKLKNKLELLLFINRYLVIIEEISNNISSEEEFIYSDLDDLEELFNQFQDFVCGEHHILKRIDDDNFDETLFY